MKIFLAVVLSFSPLAGLANSCEFPLQVFGSNRSLPCDCQFVARPSVIDGAPYFSCDAPGHASVHFKNLKPVDWEKRKKIAKDGRILEVIEGDLVHRYYVVDPQRTGVGSVEIHQALSCDSELCVLVSSSSIKGVERVLGHLKLPLLHNMALNGTSAPLRGAAAH